MKWALAAVCLLILLPVELQAAVSKCYHCLGSNTACGDTYTKTAADEQTCTAPNNAYCMKIKVGATVSRMCASACVAAHSGTDGTWCCNDADNCNSGTKVSCGLLLLLLPLISIFVGKHVF